MAERHILSLTPSARQKAIKGIEAAIVRGVAEGKAWVMELREAKRSDEQNRALWSALNQIHKHRPTHNGVKMSPELWKCVFLDALGAEMTMLPKLEGDGYFPLGHRSSRLTKGEFSALLEIILAWCAREGIALEHFDGEPSESSAQRDLTAAKNPVRSAA